MRNELIIADGPMGVATTGLERDVQALEKRLTKQEAEITKLKARVALVEETCPECGLGWGCFDEASPAQLWCKNGHRWERAKTDG